MLICAWCGEEITGTQYMFVKVSKTYFHDIPTEGLWDTFVGEEILTRKYFCSKECRTAWFGP